MKDSVIFYRDWWNAMNAMPQELQLEVYRSVFAYAFEGETPSNPLVAAFTVLMRSAIDRNEGKWNDVREKRRVAGRKGGLRTQEKYHEANQANEANQTKQAVNANDNANVNVNVNGKVNEKDKCRKTAFVPPTVEEVEDYIKEKGYRVNVENFIAYYQSNGWRVGANKMKDWHAAVVSWHIRDKVNIDNKRASIPDANDEWA